MTHSNSSGPNPKSMIRTIAGFAAAILIGSTLIFFGMRNDAVEVSLKLKSGVLTADAVNVAFENVGGRLVKRDIQESQRVRKGDVLMVIDSTDIDISLARINAVLAAQEAALAQEKEAVRIAVLDNDLTENTSWRKIEELQAAFVSARKNMQIAQREYDRASTLFAAGSASKSVFDQASNGLAQAKAALTQTSRQRASATIGATDEEMKKLERTGSAEGMTLSSVKNARETVKNRENVIASLAAQVEQSKADKAQLEVNQRRLTLVAPEDGKILKIMYENGEMIPAGAPAVLLETDRRYFDIYVSERTAMNYKPGSKVQAHVIATDATVGGTVRFAEAADSFADLRMTREKGQADLTSFQVRIYVDNKADTDAKLMTGMTLEVKDE